jgi:hypothetical protein
MPYKDIETIKKKIDDPKIREWADSLQSYQTSKLLYFLQFWAWAKKRRVKGKFAGWVTAKEMLDDYTKCKKSGEPEDEFKHLNIAKEFVKSKGTSPSDRMNAMSAIKAFYRKFDRPLQDLDSAGMMEVYSPTSVDAQRSAALTRQLTPVDIATLVRGAKKPYGAIFLIMFEGALDSSGFVQFNSHLWREPDNFDLKALDSAGPVKINGIVRSKTSYRKGSRGGDITVYYTYIGEDAKMKIKEWLAIRREMLAQAGLKKAFPYLFFNWRRGGRQKLHSSLAPITGPVLRKNLTETAKRLGLIHPPPKRERSSRTRYYFHGHEMRDCFGSMCTPAGVDKVAREFFMGHDIDRLKYDKSPYNPQYFGFYKSEYRKLMRSLDILSNPPTVEGRFQPKETLAAINRQNLLINRVPREVVDGYTDEQLASMTVEEMRRLIRSGGKDTSTAMDGNGWEPGQQKVVAATTLREWVERGWLYVATLPTGEVVIRLP